MPRNRNNKRPSSALESPNPDSHSRHEPASLVSGHIPPEHGSSPERSEPSTTRQTTGRAPPGTVGSPKHTKLLAHQKKMHSAMDTSLFEVLDKMQGRMKSQREPLLDSALDSIIGCDDGETDGFLDLWESSEEKRDLRGCHQIYMMSLWKTSLRMYRCSPLAIISPLQGLAYQPTPSRTSAPVSSMWGHSFTSTLNIVMAHPVWECRVNLLVTVLEFAVICRTDDRRAWYMLDGPKCNTLKRLDAALDARAAEMEDNGLPSSISNLMDHIALGTKTKNGASDITKSQGLEVHGLTKTDLYKVQDSIDTFTHGGYPVFTNTQVAHQGFVDSRANNDIPLGASQLEEFYRRSWIKEQRAITAANESDSDSDDSEDGDGDQAMEDPVPDMPDVSSEDDGLERLF
ncbi:hypothetical protein AK830_g11794 [Neonectria ditissima]|uniref:Uncharacterized protein n=1 Tax=Neonectria ditissima TaxID=78410 RepID=A0A0P7AQM0_9HYPO|nr:hypothetical protein AK830_g11794 [Neonectria ditissima]